MIEWKKVTDSMLGRLLKPKLMLLSSQKWRELKIKECAVGMLLANDRFILAQHRLFRIVMIKEQIMEELLGRYGHKKHHHHDDSR